MREHGVIFNSDMVRAILSGRKTQTRKAMKAQPRSSETRVGDYWFPCDRVQSMVHVSDFISGNSAMPDAHEFFSTCCPLGGIGDRIWVRETFQVGLCTESTFAYKATHKPSDLYEGWGEVIKWRPSTQMPRWASRITLEITNIRVERLQSISEEDAKAEGFDNSQSDAANSIGWFEKPIRAFRRDWENINGTDGWNSNPWVWVIEFKNAN
ncbi:hypothetical protein MMK73_003248 [Providencia rettgeri]|nr:hypothetical protein [Providencia rettgeri]